MTDEIAASLDLIEITNDVRILLAVESGSRAWGFHSIDSDYDVRFIYLNQLDWYLSLNERRDVIEFESADRLLDLNGWDLRKALRLFVKGNATLYEWLQSPVIYSLDDKFRSRIWPLASEFYPLKSGLHHYLGLIKGVVEDLGQEQIKVKRCFYGLRAAFAAHWIIQFRTIPPMTFGELRSGRSGSPEFESFIDQLLERKFAAKESFLIDSPLLLKSYFAQTIAAAESNFHSLPDPTGAIHEVDTLFRETVLARRS